MYLTYTELFGFCMFVIVLIEFVYNITRKKYPPALAKKLGGYF